ncbi:unnamed protein product [Rotaria sp. Silwood2]|nr:unnamed protein product [Rotaria sp. Silwood2]
MSVVTNFKPDYETYLHRMGRCSRFDKLDKVKIFVVLLKILNFVWFSLNSGYTFNLIGSERDFNIMKDIEEYFRHPTDEIIIEAISNLEPDQE